MLLRHHNFSLSTGLVAALFCSLVYANQDVDITASVLTSSCQIEISNGGIVDLGTVNLDYFAEGITAETDYSGGKNFTINIVSCDALSSTQSQIKIDFQPQTSPFTAGNHQVFTNEYEQQALGAKNVGIVIFSAQDNAQPFNVLDANGHSRAIYSATPAEVVPSSWKFYSRMQRVDNNTAPLAGMVRANVLVNVYYE
ncbi:fimbrial protein [Salmonella enterica subsp. enterica serovar Kotte]|nr:fimbrial protein [Salmonella enterica subsp. enterica serovar Kotte]